MTVPAQPGARDVLTQVDAEARAARVSHADYRMRFELTRGAPTYRGDVEIRFPASGNGPLFLDFRGKTIESLTVNGNAVTPDWTGFRLTLPGDALQAENVVHMVYENEYDHAGDGFHQFIDPEDGEEYLYTNFEPYEAHRLFPGFDQPDIKASYAVTVVAPSEWEVIANSPATSKDDNGDGRTRHEFAPTKRFSTYLFAIVAGPYQVARETHGDVDLGLYCRKSMAKYLDTDELFTISKQGLDFFGEFFGYAYPWGKYDQVFVPEFNAGAMENVGCVTHNEYMVFRDPPTDNQRRRRAETVLHEMAHMWFGNLVTMRWWNDLWLNESFATYMSYLCLDMATRFDAGWQDFNASIKNWAYREDQLVTTHPIAGQVADTDQTFLNFDGITYGKGASVLKQLVRTIGLEGFREGMRHYFQTHAFGNATLAQFLASLEAGSGQSLGRWSQLWLETPSLNTISATYEGDGERITSFTLAQAAPPDYQTVRPHALDIGLFRDEQGTIALDVVPAAFETESADVDGARGKARPDLVLPNYGDHAFAKLSLDEDSVAFLRENIERFEETLTRQLLWSALWSMVRDQQLKTQDFLELVRTKIRLEPTIEIVDSILGYAVTGLARYLPGEMRDEQAHLLFEMAWEGLREAPQGDAQIIWARTILGSAVTPPDVERAAELVDGKVSIDGLVVDQQMRWSMATRMCSLDMQGANERVEQELARDPSDRGQRAKITADTSFPDAAVKQSAWEKFTGEGYGSLYLTEAAMAGFNWWRQRDLLAPYVDRFFGEVRGIFDSRDKEFASAFFNALFPSYRPEPGILQRSEGLLADLGGQNPVLERKLREANDELERTIKCHEFARS